MLPLKLVPGLSTIKKIIKRTFHLKYASLNKANLKYRDPTYNEKRLWVSRLLTQFMFEEAIIISIDESNFRSDSVPNKQWQFNEKLSVKRRFPKTLSAPPSKHVLFATDGDLY